MRSLVELHLDVRQWVKGRGDPVSSALYQIYTWRRTIACPTIPYLHRSLYEISKRISAGFKDVMRILWYTPLFQSRLEQPAKRLFLYGGLPFIDGTVSIRIGSSCRVAGKLDIVGRSAGAVVPRLTVGDNVDLGWGSRLAVGRLIRIGNNVRFAPGVFLAGYPGHPIDARARARGEPDTDDQVGDIVIEDDVWLGTSVTVNRGVTIGRGTIVATGSIVSSDLPPFVLAAGVPAVIKRQLRP